MPKKTNKDLLSEQKEGSNNSGKIRDLEWLETDGLGGFSMGTTLTIPKRRYHALLVVSKNPPTHRVALVNAIECWVVIEGERFPLSSFCYDNNTIHPNGFGFIDSFEGDPWPKWNFKFPKSDLKIGHEIFMPHESSSTILSWKQISGRSPASLEVRPLLTGRDYHSTHKANDVFSFSAASSMGCVEWSPYADIPTITTYFNGSYEHSPEWFYNFAYPYDQARGFSDTEDFASPGIFRWDLSQGEAYLIFNGNLSEKISCLGEKPVDQAVQELRQKEMRRRSLFPTPLHRAADHYVVKRGEHKSILAGYPWFTDWGRDTFIAFRGICVQGGRIDDGAEILKCWVDTISLGMIPNRFPDIGSGPEYNSVDASLWFVIAAYTFDKVAKNKYPELIKKIKKTTNEILTNYYNGTRFRIMVDEDGLLKAGLMGTQLTWMDAKFGDTVFTPRSGKPVELQALWINALKIGSEWFDEWEQPFLTAMDWFGKKFWNSELNCLFDVVDVDNQVGINDGSIRPNQILAVGGLPYQVLRGAKATKVVACVEENLLTPFGLRTLNKEAKNFSPYYVGDSFARDRAYHQGTAWTWLLGPFVEAWVRVNGSTNEIKLMARKRFLDDLIDSMYLSGGYGSLNEIHDAVEPHTPRGCPFQAWSIAEVIRLYYGVLQQTHDEKVLSSKSSNAIQGLQG